MALKTGDKVWVHLSDGEIAVCPQLDKYNKNQYEVAEVHCIRPTRGRGGSTQTIYRLKDVTADSGLPFWFTAEHLHRYSPLVLEKIANQL